MSNLHNQIINIQVNNPRRNDMTDREKIAYQLGHRDARHEAAELCGEAAAYIEELERVARTALKELEYAEQHMLGGMRNTAAEQLRETLGTPTQYIIRNGEAERLDDVEYWNNNMGWVDRENATKFIQIERDNFDLPIGGYWERI